MFAKSKEYMWFLKRILPLKPGNLVALSNMDEFSTMVLDMIRSGSSVNEREIYLMIKKVYKHQMDLQRSSGKSEAWFNEKRTKRVLCILWSDMTGLPEATWGETAELSNGDGISRALSNEDILRENRMMVYRFQRLSFLYQMLQIGGINVNTWIFDDEFATEIEALIKDGFRIDSRTVFLIMRRIYLEKEKKREENPQKFDNFDFKIARSGIVSLWENLTGSREGWRDGEI